VSRAGGGVVVPELGIHLLSPSGCLSLEAANPQQHRELLDGLRRLRAKVATLPSLP
jgi:hypothetical protein